MKIAADSSNCQPVANSERDSRALPASFALTGETSTLRERAKSHVNVHITRDGLPTRALRPINGEAALAVAVSEHSHTVVAGRVFQITEIDEEVAAHAGHEIDDIVGVKPPVLWRGAAVMGDLSVHIWFPTLGTYRLWLAVNIEGQPILISQSVLVQQPIKSLATHARENPRQTLAKATHRGKPTFAHDTVGLL